MVPSDSQVVKYFQEYRARKQEVGTGTLGVNGFVGIMSSDNNVCCISAQDTFVLSGTRSLQVASNDEGVGSHGADAAMLPLRRGQSCPAQKNWGCQRAGSESLLRSPFWRLSQSGFSVPVTPYMPLSRESPAADSSSGCQVSKLPAGAPRAPVGAPVGAPRAPAGAPVWPPAGAPRAPVGAPRAAEVTKQQAPLFQHGLPSPFSSHYFAQQAMSVSGLDSYSEYNYTCPGSLKHSEVILFPRTSLCLPWSPFVLSSDRFHP